MTAGGFSWKIRKKNDMRVMRAECFCENGRFFFQYGHEHESMKKACVF